jgi:NADH dehydrogenase [ubiquinone] 1 alpha subcomplex assembly factor 6
MATIPGSVDEVRCKTPVPERRSAEADGLSPVAALVRRHDRDRFQTVLFAPAARREALFALYAFNYEIARVRESVTEPTLGQIRLEWWRENVAAAYQAGAVRRHPVAEALTATIREYALTRELVDRLIDARESNLEDEPPVSLAALEAYAAGSSANLVRLALEVLSARDPAAGEAGHHVGIAYAVAGMIRAIPFQARTGLGAIPTEIAERHGVGGRDYRELRHTVGLRRATAEIAAAATEHLGHARAHRVRVPRSALPALLPAQIAQRWLIRLKWARYDPFDPSLAFPDPLQSWRLAVSVLLNRF